MAVLGWRGIVCSHVIVFDTFLLLGRVSWLPFWFRTHWAAESTWLIFSFAGLTLGLDELCAVAEGWVGKASTIQEPYQVHAYALSVFCALCLVHLTGLLFAPSNQRRRLAALSVSIEFNTAILYGMLFHKHMGGLVLQSTYGKPFTPLRYVLWAHTSPGLALIVSGPSLLPMCETRRHQSAMIVGVMVSGLVATTAVPPPLVRLGGDVGLWGWRILWCLLSCAALFCALGGIKTAIYERLGRSQISSRWLVAFVYCAWTIFPVTWFLGQAALITEVQEACALACADFIAKMLATVVLLQSSAAELDQNFHSALRNKLDHEHKRAGVLETFARSMGHDLRTPLQALVFSNHMAGTAVESLLHACTEGRRLDRETELSTLRTLSKQVHQGQACTHVLSLVVSNLWELDSIETDSDAIQLPSPHTEEMVIGPALLRTVELLKASPTAKPHVLIKSVIDERIPIVRGDASRLMRALLNLLVNALKFTDEGSVVVTTTLLKQQDGRCNVLFQVSDTGRGMSEAQIASATKPYYRSSVAQDGGMGLGLAIVSKAVSSLGGKLTIVSPGLGYGTTCSFALSLEVADEPLGETHGAVQRPVRVLLVDDVEIILAGAREIIGSLGHEVKYVASDGEEALRILITHAEDIDVAFVDIRLPKLFGDAAVAQYRSWEREHRQHKRPLRIYATSGDVTAEGVRDHEACGFDGTLAKPVYPDAYNLVCRGGALPAEIFAHRPSGSEAATSEGGTSFSSSTRGDDSFTYYAASSLFSRRTTPGPSSSLTASPLQEELPPSNSSVLGSGLSDDAALPHYTRSAPLTKSPSSSLLGSQAGGTSQGSLYEAPGAASQSSDAIAALTAEILMDLPPQIIRCSDMVTELGLSVEIAVALVSAMSNYLRKMINEMRQKAASDLWNSTKTGEKARSGGDIFVSSQGVSGIAHSVKGAALQIFAVRLNEISLVLEMAAKQGRSDQAIAAHAVWVQVAEELLATLENCTSYEQLFEAPVLSALPTRQAGELSQAS